MNTPTRPSTHYQRAVDRAQYQHDAAQAAALLQLDRIHQKLTQPARLLSWPLGQLVNWRALWPYPKKHGVTGAYLYGGVGSGKTLLMDLFYHALPCGMAKRIHFHRYMQSVHAQKNQLKHQAEPLRRIAQHSAARYRVLCLDEFAVTDITDAMLLYGLLKHLFHYGVSLITTSNTPPEQLYRGGLQRVRFLPAIELLQQHTHLIKVDSGQDYRLAFLQNAATYRTPLNAATEHSLQQTFANLAGQHDTSKRHLTLSGREVPVRATGSGTVWFDCEVLCEAPRSKLDYIELSRRFHTLFVSNLRVFDALRDDAARRFIELIDAIYDRGVNLLVSAEVPPQQLYQGKRLHQPFQRTVSRLQEMQSADYFARPHLG